MGTYTTNYNLFLPDIGEQGWGELVNGNFATIDTTMLGLNTRIGTAESNITSLTTRMGTAETTITSNESRIGTMETEIDGVKNRVTTLEAGEFETVNVAGTITADEFVGGVGNFSSILVGVNTTGGLFSTTLSTTGMPLFDSDSTNTGTFTITASGFVSPSTLLKFVVTVKSFYNGSFTDTITIDGIGSKTVTLPSNGSIQTVEFDLPAGTYTLTSGAWQRHTCYGGGDSITYYIAINAQ